MRQFHIVINGDNEYFISNPYFLSVPDPCRISTWIPFKVESNFGTDTNVSRTSILSIEMAFRLLSPFLLLTKIRHDDEIIKHLFDLHNFTYNFTTLKSIRSSKNSTDLSPVSTGVVMTVMVKSYTISVNLVRDSLRYIHKAAS